MKSSVLSYLSDLIEESDQKLYLTNDTFKSIKKDSKSMGYLIASRIENISRKNFFSSNNIISNLDETNQYNMF